MKSVILIAGMLLVLLAGLALEQSAERAGMTLRDAVSEALRQDDAESSLTTASSSQRATAVCVGLVNWKSCQVDQDSTATIPLPPAPKSDGTAGFVVFGMLFVSAGLLAMILTRFLFGNPNEW